MTPVRIGNHSLVSSSFKTWTVESISACASLNSERVRSNANPAENLYF